MPKVLQHFVLIMSLTFLCPHIEAHPSVVTGLDLKHEWNKLGKKVKKIFNNDESTENIQKSSPSRYVSDQVWKQVREFILPDDHPIKEELDQIFSTSFRPFYDLHSMEIAGFIPAKPQHHTKVIVTKHPQLPGYVIKAYLDVQDYHLGKPEHYFWTKRIKGADLLRKSIQKHHYEHLLKTPHKWIYLLPDEPLPPSPCLCKRFILVEEDMNIYDDKANIAFWKSTHVTHSLLNALYQVITEVGLDDCAKPANCPISKDGKIALIDTQSYHEKSIKYNKLTPYLSPANQQYWLKITN